VVGPTIVAIIVIDKSRSSRFGIGGIDCAAVFDRRVAVSSLLPA
jgi:hypothetical protein